MTVTQSDKGLAKIAEGASSRRHAETSPVKVKDTHLMNNKLPPAEILCGDWCGTWRKGPGQSSCNVLSISDLELYVITETSTVVCDPVTD